MLKSENCSDNGIKGTRNPAKFPPCTGGDQRGPAEGAHAHVFEAIQGQPPDQGCSHCSSAAYFTLAQRIATRHSARIAGLDVLHFMDEPSAAALTYA